MTERRALHNFAELATQFCSKPHMPCAALQIMVLLCAAQTGTAAPPAARTARLTCGCQSGGDGGRLLTRPSSSSLQQPGRLRRQQCLLQLRASSGRTARPAPGGSGSGSRLPSSPPSSSGLQPPSTPRQCRLLPRLRPSRARPAPPAPAGSSSSSSSSGDSSPSSTRRRPPSKLRQRRRCCCCRCCCRSCRSCRYRCCSCASRWM